MARSTIVPIIINNIPFSKIIYTDSASYHVNNRRNNNRSFLTTLGYKHYFVNHIQEYVNSLFNFVHTNSIESQWAAMKKHFKRISIRKITQLDLDVYAVLKNYSIEDITERLINYIIN